MYEQFGPYTPKYEVKHQRGKTSENCRDAWKEVCRGYFFLFPCFVDLLPTLTEFVKVSKDNNLCFVQSLLIQKYCLSSDNFYNYTEIEEIV